MLDNNLVIKSSTPSVCFVGLKNIPVLIPEYNNHGIGGEEVQQTLLAKSLTNRGYKVSMVCADYGQKNESTHDNITVYNAFKFTAGFPVVRYFYPRFTGLWKAISNADADIYYVSCANMIVGLVALYAKYKNKKVIFKVASDSDCDPKTLLIKYWRDKKLYEYGLTNTHKIFVQHDEQKRNLFKNYQLKSQVINMLVEPCQNNYNYEERDITVLWVNNIRGLKRPELFLALTQKIPGTTVHMIGGEVSGHEGLYKETENASSKIDNVTFHGRVPYHEVNKFYEKAKVFVNTSDIEGFPNSYLQSWVRGVPVIAFFDPGGLIKKEGLGVIVENIDEMAEAIKLYSNDITVWENASLRCKKFMDENFNEDEILNPLLNALNIKDTRERQKN